jgi:hypothetical protein
MKALTHILTVALSILILSACEEESDLAFTRVSSPVVVDVADSNPSEITATISELDKSGILDNTVGIKYLPVAGLEVTVFAGGAELGKFTTNNDGKIVVAYPGGKPNEYAGVHNGIAFRIKK